ncbi:hypothetical protein BDZ90DRAFT_232067 [Jaminaea rosea]|uniref:EB1-like protein n=1 Tax=Jaminaea rosea TaxID=1569628 RepID=A0A316US95_9BASI|nr:hypothetical protein BDZ90DRAFT_232067 [Jaminaea rosea]PWN27648.1 hypothetical protein BDZ90DRAFT_232067 [Jaminaea rosea]
MGESRSELLAWLNELLALNYTKVEQCGSGYAYAQIIDSIYGNVPMSKLNPAAKQEYEFINNFKVLQTAFKKNKITKPIPVEALVRCKMQDNLEFLQWIKKFWDTNYPGTPYDPEARRSGAAAAPPPLIGAATVGAARPAAAAAAPRAAPRAAPAAAAPVRRPVGGAGAGVARASGAASAVSNETIAALTEQMDEMRVSVDTLEKERDFYFSKLRDIEVLITERLTAHESGEPLPEDALTEEALLKQMQAILYSTEEGFELPEGAEAPVNEEETF